jgi:hypothetical protein
MIVGERHAEELLAHVRAGAAVASLTVQWSAHLLSHSTVCLYFFGGG